MAKGGELAGEVAVVVGAARGLGLAIAGAFLDAGASTVLVDRDRAVEDSAASLSARGRVMALVDDAVDAEAMRAAYAHVADAWQRCDHVVYAAAIGSGKFGFPYWSLAPADWDAVWRVNVMGAVNVAHAFGPRLAEAGRGTLLFIGSVAGQIGSQTDPPYSASKAALINFAQCAAKDLAPYGVRVNTINPGMVRTSLNRSVYEAWAARQPEALRGTYESWTAEKIAKLVPLNRWQEPEDIAAMAVFLASDRGRNITGQAINVDGGYVMHW
jgi:NAD(P)-dependent dehydrogenase (short-subunit alcohol dehydrogenase family)